MKPGPGPIMTVEAVFFRVQFFLNFTTCCFYLLNVGSTLSACRRAPKKVQKIVPGCPCVQNRAMMKTAPVWDFLENYELEVNWHDTCLIFIKSDTLISFLLKKVCFVPQSGPFSIGKNR